uniref:Secreted protein n=1 Tax=Trichuris muris TaxID=70415 RepID=A0A5S6QA68_TRIMR
MGAALRTLCLTGRLPAVVARTFTFVGPVAAATRRRSRLDVASVIILSAVCSPLAPDRYRCWPFRGSVDPSLHYLRRDCLAESCR